MAEKQNKGVDRFNWYHYFALMYFVLLIGVILTSNGSPSSDYSVFIFLLLGEIRYYTDKKYYVEAE